MGTGGGPLGERGVVGQRRGGPRSRVSLKDPVYAHDWLEALLAVCVCGRSIRRYDTIHLHLLAYIPGEDFVRFLLLFFFFIREKYGDITKNVHVVRKIVCCGFLTAVVVSWRPNRVAASTGVYI